MNRFRILALLAALPLAAGCSTFAVSRYSVSPDNQEEIRALEARAPGATSQIGPFIGLKDAGRTEIGCRAAGPVQLPDGLTFSQYLRKGLSDEMRAAGIYSTSSGPKISVTVQSIGINSYSGTWDVRASAEIDDQQFPVEVKHRFGAGAFDSGSCPNAANAFVAEAQDFVRAIITNPKFAAALSKSSHPVTSANPQRGTHQTEAPPRT